MSEHVPPPVDTRACGACSLCCSVLRVDELSKRAGTDCEYRRPEGGCAIHPTRPGICRAYRCLWLQGGLEDSERPDRIGGVVDLQSVGVETRLVIQEAHPGAFDASPALQAVVERYRTSMPVRLVEAGRVDDPDRPYRIWLTNGEAQRVVGEWRDIERPGQATVRERLPFFERVARRVAIAIRRLELTRLERRRSRVAKR